MAPGWNPRLNAITLELGESAVRRAAELAPADADTWAALGKVLRRTGDLLGSEAAYREAARELYRRQKAGVA